MSDSKKKIAPNKSFLHRPLTLDDCLLWSKDKSKNPISKYTLSEKSKILGEIRETCDTILDNYAKSNTNEKKTQNPVQQISIDKQEKTKRKFNKDNDGLYYPDLDEDNFRNKLSSLYEYYLYTVSENDAIKNRSDFEHKSNELCSGFEKTLYQYFISHYISSRTPYNGILLYHGVGVGKTCSAITLSEGFLASHNTSDEPKIWVIMPYSLQNSFKEQIFSLANYENFEKLSQQCTGDTYIKMSYILQNYNIEKAQQKIKKLIKSRYRLFTYESFATFIETEYAENNSIVKDKVIIVDEAHNIRSKSNENSEKRVYKSLANILAKGMNNKLVLLSATPMYNVPEDIFDLLYLLLLNDKRKDILKQPFPSLFDENNTPIRKSFDIMKKLASNYISYLRGRNPFSFAVKLSANEYLDDKYTFLKKELTYDPGNKVIGSTYKNWLSNIEDGIMISRPGIYQKQYIEKQNIDDDNNANFNGFQPLNIVYDEDIGEKGFANFFSRVEKPGSLIVKYNKEYVNSLYPDAGNLGKYSGKFLNICNTLKNSNGIVVIYSNFIWSGIIPMAICLEHMGLSRAGSNNILGKNDKNKFEFNNLSQSKYCILSSDPEIMGSSTIDSIVKLINSPSNINGSLVKVILMTPVASEGLSFFNVREMHLMEPWFHYNKVKQIIGRGNRNCRHQNLALEDRNVTVFMHACQDNSNKESHDVRAYRLASKKHIQSKIVDQTIRDNSIDCHFMKNLNYFPKSLFELGKMKINTSQNIAIDIEYGDDKEYQPKCNVNINLNKNGFRKETYQNFIKPLQNRLKLFLLNKIKSNKWFVTQSEIMDILKIDEEIVYEVINKSVYPYNLIENYLIVPHENGIHIVEIPNTTSKRFLITDTEQKENVVNTKKCKMPVLKNKSIEEATILIYLNLNSICFEELVTRLLKTNTLSQQDEFIAQCLHLQGVLISKSELPYINNDNNYIGYVDIFDSKFKAKVLSNNKFRSLIDKEEKDLFNIRTQIDNLSKDKTTWGMITHIEKKKENNMKTNALKIIRNGNTKGISTGRVCKTLDKKEQEEILKEFGNNNTYDNKVENCFHIALELMKNNKLILLPEYKPRQ